MIDLEQPRLQLVIKHNVEPEQIHTQVWLLRLASSVEVLQLGLNREDSFDDNLLHLRPYVVRSFAVALAFGV